MPLHGANRQRPTNSKGVDMNKFSGIYQVNLGNGWFYIGSAIDLTRRKREHLRTLKFKIHVNSHMQNCWNKYSIFEFVILEECEITQLLLREQFFLDIHFDDPKNVNLQPIAGSCLGQVRSAETRAKMSAWQIGKVHSAETRAKISAANKGKVHSAEHRAKNSAAKKGKIHSVDIRAKISAGSKAYHARRRVAKLK